MATYARPTYPNEVNPLPDGWHDIRRNRCVDWTHPDLKEITRFRLLSDPGFPFWDVSYCHGVMKDGQHVRVSLPFSQLPKSSWKGALIREAVKAGINAKRLGMFDNVSLLW